MILSLDQRHISTALTKITEGLSRKQLSLLRNQFESFSEKKQFNNNKDLKNELIKVSILSIMVVSESLIVTIDGSTRINPNVINCLIGENIGLLKSIDSIALDYILSAKSGDSLDKIELQMTMPSLTVIRAFITTISKEDAKNLRLVLLGAKKNGGSRKIEGTLSSNGLSFKDDSTTLEVLSILILLLPESFLKAIDGALGEIIFSK